MSDPYIGEIRMFGGIFAPANWAFCDGQLLSISEYEALFVLIGTTYGGDGQTTFALPDLSSRIPIGRSSRRPLGTSGGEETVTVSVAHLPTHTHSASAGSTAASSTSPGNRRWAASGSTPYTSQAPSVPMSGAALAPSGGGQPHENRPPYLAVNYIIALLGIFPSQP